MMRIDDEGVNVVRYCQLCEGVLECVAVNTYDDDCIQGTFKCVDCEEEHFGHPNIDGTSRITGHTALEDLPKSKDQEKIAELEKEIEELKQLFKSRF